MPITQITDHSPTPKLPFKILEAQGAESCWNMLEPFGTYRNHHTMSSYVLVFHANERNEAEPDGVWEANQCHSGCGATGLGVKVLLPQCTQGRKGKNRTPLLDSPNSPQTTSMNTLREHPQNPGALAAVPPGSNIATYCDCILHPSADRPV